MANSASSTRTNRVIALIDMDCFYVQVEERDDPSIKGVPAAVVQYKAYKGGGIIAVNYEARAKGVTRSMRGDDAKAACPEIQLVRVPENRGKADLTKYRDAGREVINVLSDFSACVERASIDEAYIDLSEAVELRLAEISSQDMFMSLEENIVQSLKKEYLATNFVLGHECTEAWLQSLKENELPSLDDLKLAIGAEIVGQMRDAVYKRTSFRCSAGIAHNKVLAKLVCGINKPNKQTVLPHASVPDLWSRTKIGKVRGLGGKLGDFVETLGCVHMSDLRKFTEKELSAVLGPKTGAWLHQLSLGYDDEAVTPRQLPKSIGCNKMFNGPEALKTKDKVKFWITQLAIEVAERVQRDLETNTRRAKVLTLHVKFEGQNALSRSCGVPNYNSDRMATDAYSVMEKLYQSVGVLPVVTLGLIASKFEDEADTTGISKINEFFKAKPENGHQSSNTVLGNGDESKKALGITSRNILTASTSKSSFPNLTTTNSKKILPSTETSTKATTESVESSHNVGEINIGKTVQLETPKKSSSVAAALPTDESPRKPFFKFIETAPKPISPNKSPRKIVQATSSLKIQDALPSRDFCEANPSLLKECERCGKKLLEWDFASHMDYHFAKDLSRELNGLPKLEFQRSPNKKPTEPQSVPERSSSKGILKRPRGRGASSSSVGSKRGRGAKTNLVTPASSSRSIDSYFGPKV